MGKLQTLTLVAICCILTYWENSAVAGPGKETKKAISLNAKQVSECVKVLPVFIKEFPEFNPLKGAKGKPGAKPNMAAMIAEAKIKKLDAFSVKHGYKDFNNFARHFTGVMSGYMYYKTLEAKKMFDAQAKNLPPETAMIMAAQMKPINSSLEKLKKTVTPELLAAVKPHVAELNKIMGLTGQN